MEGDRRLKVGGWAGAFLAYAATLAIGSALYAWVGRPIVEAGGSQAVLSLLSWLRGWSVPAEDALDIADRIALSGLLLSTFVLAYGMHAAGLASRRLVVFVLLLIGGGIRLHIAFQDPVYLYHWPLDDDSYYFFEVAHNLANGNGLRHDSFNTMTGVQPLFVLLITPIFWLVASKTLAVSFVLYLQVGTSLLLAVALTRLLRTVAGDSASLFALAIWAFSGYLVSTDMNGLETSLSLLFVCLVSQRYYQLLLAEAPPGGRALVGLGALLGLAFLARNDNGLLGLAIALHMIVAKTAWTWPLEARLRGAAIVAAWAGAFALPWLALNLTLVGGLLPSGGQAVRFLSLAYGYVMMQGSGPAFEVENVPLAYYEATVSHALLILREVLGRGIVPLWAGLVLGLAGLVAGWRHGVRRLLARFAFLWAFLGALVLSYTLYIFGQWFFDRYFAPIALGYLLALGIALQALLERASKLARPRLKGALEMGLAVALAGSLLADSVLVLAPPREKVPGFVDAAQWLNRNAPKTAVVGAFQSGIFGYHLQRRFYGLDGKINIDALEALRAQRIDEYVQDKGIDYLVDWQFVLHALLSNRSVDPHFLERQEVVYSNGEVLVYRLNRRR